MNTVKTKYGEFLPYSGASDLRKKYRCPVEYHDNGNVRSIYLQKPVTACFPAGKFQAEMMTFYEDGSIKRIFPLYGQLSAYWSIEDEVGSAPYYRFGFSGNDINVRPQCLFFYPSGKLRSITLWPGDEIEIITPAGSIVSGLGIELYENGSLRSIEPVFGTVIQTPYGEVKPYIYRALMLHAENASMVFSEDGKLKSLKTLTSVLGVNGTEYKASGYRYPLSISFGDGEIVIGTGKDQDIRIGTVENSVRFL